jgi:hypothetical protein
MQRSKFNALVQGAAFVAALFVCAPAFSYHLVLEANPGAPFPFLSRFGTTELHVYPHGVRGETIWLNGFSRNGEKNITVENPLARMYTEVPVTSVGPIVAKLATALPKTLEFSAPPPVLAPVDGTVHGIAAKRYRIVYGPEAWIDLWTTDKLGDAPQLRAIVLQLIGGISPLTAKSAARVPGLPLYVELNFSHFKKVAIVKVKTLTFDDVGEEDALKVGRLYVHAPLLDSLWK